MGFFFCFVVLFCFFGGGMVGLAGEGKKEGSESLRSS